ncbi:ribonuclease T2 family protein [Marinibacterium profundimaris]|uniref:Uncharacterized protein n=1 Tax=Marinibacterium profundimaris TaxID=1679460 RepID=A0A225NV10_9RHOB|nr:ribonuclease T [Marinibacterium profundimaris]OWU75656.1 hypothetical protein ATO3_05440 [Marinibacterium profundimaris]
MFRFLLSAVLPALSLAALGGAVQAQLRLDGWFIAQDRCELYQSKNSLTNPGGLRAEPRLTYDMIGRNTQGGDWYQVKVPGAPVTPDRWIHGDCGIHVVAATPGPDGRGPPPEGFEPAKGEEATDLLMAVSWQPAFCEQRPLKTECRQLNDGLLPFTETRLSIHGLWPQPRGVEYCGVPQPLIALDRDGRWQDLPAPELDADTAERLATAMPGTASFLERHEWIRHGTCFFGAGGADEYFDDTLRVLDAINDSPVGALMEARVGAELSGAELRAAFDAAFGVGAGDRVTVECRGDRGRLLIQELKIALKGQITETADVGVLILAADPLSPGCDAGIVDAAGLQ